MAAAMQAKHRALRSRKVAARAGRQRGFLDRGHRALDLDLTRRIDHGGKATPDDVERAVQKLLEVLAREIRALADLERQHAVLARALDQLRIAARREMRAGIAGGAAHHVAIAALD